MAHVYSLGFLHGEPGAAELVDKAIAGLHGPLHDDEMADGIRPFPQTAPPMKQARSATPTLS